eukprot:12344278-Heterocapsa_arctica.AAC.1
MRKAGYRSAISYAYLAVQRHETQFGNVQPGVQNKLRALKRACKRGLGPARQTDVFPFAKLLQVGPEDWIVERDAPLGQHRMGIIGMWWMLREIELAALTVGD